MIRFPSTSSRRRHRPCDDRRAPIPWAGFQSGTSSRWAFHRAPFTWWLIRTPCIRWRRCSTDSSQPSTGRSLDLILTPRLSNCSPRVTSLATRPCSANRIPTGSVAGKLPKHHTRLCAWPRSLLRCSCATFSSPCRRTAPRHRLAVFPFRLSSTPCSMRWSTGSTAESNLL
jgi:hypothetical protein